MNSSPCAKFTTSMMPKISVSPEAISARIMPVTTPLTVWIRNWSNGKLCRTFNSIAILDPQELLDDRIVHGQARRGRMMADRALLHEIDPLARFQRQRDVLLDQKDCDALLMQCIDDGADLRHHARHQAFGR